MTARPGAVESRTVPAAIDPAAFRSLMRRHAAGVSVITLESDSGPVGFTATSLASLSAEPPLVCFNIAHTSSSLTALRAAQSLVIHVLDERDRAIAERFSRTAAERFADASSWTTLGTGEPLLVGVQCWMRVALVGKQDIGDHVLVVGQVTKAGLPDGDADPVRPLIYHDGRYHHGVPVREV
ncbi:NADH-dependent FMN reductase DszD [Gordonia polyisoprenivorans NBRC 16320 = JCM 10675]|uniref:Flavin reductase family protein n=1 Tax=Gordonia polyisoprenivorans TaxID=84595 RepID=A0A846WVW4_9ACTN|nr:flavin reductase family protein [Gordonia polyisoprenivorans]NKY05187.1 flavin reductase family protein [Gordonia polyisoprenivorans]GAB24076.1 NADH-dependent FMN reductase DszD [Gordonia polyisoprenivorans NBRC 16320 = JCM 10675]